MFIEYIGSALDNEKSLIDDFTSIVDVQNCPTKFLPFLGALTDYTYSAHVDDKVHRHEIWKRIEALKRGSTYDGYERVLKYHVRPDSLIKNGSFEYTTGTLFDNWTMTSSGSAVFTSSTDTTLKEAQSLHLSLSSSNTKTDHWLSFASSKFTLNPDENYNFYVYGKHESPYHGNVQASLLVYDKESSYLNFSDVDLISVYSGNIYTNFDKYSSGISYEELSDGAGYGQIVVTAWAAPTDVDLYLDNLYFSYAVSPETDRVIFESYPFISRFEGSHSITNSIVFHDSTKKDLETDKLDGGKFNYFSLSKYDSTNLMFNAFTRSGTDIIDESDALNTATIVGSIGTGEDYYNRGAIIFKGGRVEIPNDATLSFSSNSFFIDMTLFTNTFGYEQNVWNKQSAGVKNNLYITTEGKFWYFSADGTTTVSLTSSKNYLDNGYRRVSVHMDQSGSAYMFVNGDVVDSAGFGAAIDVVNANSFFVGGDVSSTNTFLGHISALSVQIGGVNTSYPDHVAPYYWTISGDPYLRRDTSTTFNKYYSLHYSDDNIDNYISAVCTNFSTSSSWISWKIPCYLESGTVVIRGLNADADTTYFTHTFTDTGSWLVLGLDYPIGTNTGFDGRISVSGSAYFEEALLADVTPRPRWDQQRFIGREYAPYTTVVDSTPHQEHLYGEICDQKPAGGKLILRQSHYDPAESVSTSYSDLSVMSTFVEWAASSWDDTDYVMWSGEANAMGFAPSESLWQSNQLYWQQVGRTTFSMATDGTPEYIMVAKDKNDRYAWGYFGVYYDWGPYSGEDREYQIYHGISELALNTSAYFPPEVRHGNFTLGSGDYWTAENTSALKIVSYDTPAGMAGTYLKLQGVSVTSGSSDSSIPLMAYAKISFSPTMNVNTGARINSYFWRRYGTSAASTDSIIYFFAYSGRTSGYWNIRDYTVSGNEAWVKVLGAGGMVVDIAQEGMYFGFQTEEAGVYSGTFNEKCFVDAVEYIKITRAANDIWADQTMSTRSYAYVESGFDPNADYTHSALPLGGQHRFQDLEAGTWPECRLFKVVDIPITVSMNVYKSYYE
jgi:hypothetical protein